MILYPAIDLYDGQAVRLRQGKRGERTVYGDPVVMARRWRGMGAQWLHLVDLEAAFDGATRQLPLLKEIVAAFGGPVELGGGLRAIADIDARMDAGVSRCIIGTAAAEHPELVAEACRKYPGHIAVGIDARDGIVATRGWTEQSGLRAEELALRMRDLGVDTVIYTDISRDGMMQGANIPVTRSLIRATGMQVIGSGGVTTLADIRGFASAGCAGCILGKALYEGAFTLEEALACVR